MSKQIAKITIGKKKYKYSTLYNKRLNGWLLYINDKDIGLKFKHRIDVKKFVRAEGSDIIMNGNKKAYYKEV